MSGLVVGIDADTRRLAWVAVDAEGVVVEYGVILRRRGAGGCVVEPTYATELWWLCGWCARKGARVWVEGVYFKPALDGQARCSMKGFMAHREAVDEIVEALRAAGVEVSTVRASEWQSALFGRGLLRAELKEKALAAVRDVRWRRGEDRWNEHLADAVCIARWGVGIRGVKTKRGLAGAGKQQRRMA